MNSLKPLIVVAVLVVVAYGVYLSITRRPETANSPGDAPPWSGAPQVQIPGPAAAMPQFPAGPSERGAAGQYPQGPTAGNDARGAGRLPVVNSPLAAPRGTTAPQFTPPATSPTPVDALAEGSTAPSYPSTTYPSTSAGATSPMGSDRQMPGSNSASNPFAPSSDVPANRPFGSGLPSDFDAVMQSVHARLGQRQIAQAYRTLNSLYGTPGLSPAQQREVIDLLDQLAGTVIYSPEHLLEAPYLVRPGETLEEIAQRYDVPWQLLARINGISDPHNLPPGQQLKVVRGPFSAVVDLDRYELTLILQGRYAGRFSIGVGVDRASLEGDYVVCNQTVNPQYYGPGRVEIGADDPNNPLGELWIGLGKQLGEGGQIGIHGTDNPGNLLRTGGRGWIRLGDRDAEDVFGILSIGSRVVIRR